MTTIQIAGCGKLNLILKTHKLSNPLNAMLPSTTFICFVICMTHFQTINYQICTNGLTNPPELIWTPSPTPPHIPQTTLTFDASTKTWNNNTISLTTRLYNNK
eukprot:130581_1